MTIKFGTAGMGPVKDVEETFKKYKEIGLSVAEIPFTYGVFIKDKKVAEHVGEVARKYGITLSIHAPYWINLNSAEKEKVGASRQRIIKCLEVGTWLGAKVVVFHPGYYGKMEKEKTYENIVEQIKKIQDVRKEKKYTPKLAPETTGKVNVFGSPEEIKKLVDDTGCSFCIDFAHVLARYKDYRFDDLKKLFAKERTWHLHFSGIEYGEKGEKKHKKTEKADWGKLLNSLPKSKDITIINEAPTPFVDAVEGFRLYSKK